MSLTDDQIVAKNFKKYHEAILPYLNGSAHSGFTPIGTVISVMGTTAPLNYLACDGTVYNISDYTELAAYFNAQFGSSNFFGGNGTTTFAVPDLRGEFLRGTGTNSHANQGSGANVGEHQDGTEHLGINVSQDNQLYLNGGAGVSMFPNNSDSTIANTNKTGRTTNTTTLTWTGSGITHITSRPTNTSVLYCIASKNIFMDAGSNYSTEEQVVGTWIDGKPIYQKTINFGTLPNRSIKTVAHNISNIDIIFLKDGFLWDNSAGTARVLPFVHDTEASNVTFYVNKTNMTIENRSFDWSSLIAYVTLQYTKTTD